MVTGWRSEQSRRIMEEYALLDADVERFKKATGLCCRPGCGECCGSEQVEATTTEVLPLTEEIFRRGEEHRLYDTVEAAEKAGRSICVLYRPEMRPDGAGHCGYYPFRPLLCRLFGFATRKRKTGNLEFATCRLIKETFAPEVARAEIAIAEGIVPPIFPEAFMRLTAINPGGGFRPLPINQAIREALSQIYWTSPDNFRTSKAVSF